MKSTLILIAIATVICATHVSVLAEDAPAGPKTFRRISIPEREHGYASVEPMVIRTQAELDGFLKSVQEQGAWNNRKDFEDAITKAKIDFSKEALVFLPHTEGSGSVRVTFERPSLHDTVLTCKITRKEPEMGTSDMAYYCFALAVSKSATSTVELHVQGKKPIELSIVEKSSNKPDAGDGK